MIHGDQSLRDGLSRLWHSDFAQLVFIGIFMECMILYFGTFLLFFLFCSKNLESFRSFLFSVPETWNFFAAFSFVFQELGTFLLLSLLCSRNLEVIYWMRIFVPKINFNTTTNSKLQLYKPCWQACKQALEAHFIFWRDWSFVECYFQINFCVLNSIR